MFGDFTRPLLKSKFLDFLGRDPHPTANGRAVMNIASGGAPGFRFEWHPQRRRVYLVRIGRAPEIGEVIAFDIETHGDAINAVLIFTRGFKEGRTPGVKPHLIE